VKPYTRDRGVTVIVTVAVSARGTPFRDRSERGVKVKIAKMVPPASLCLSVSTASRLTLTVKDRAVGLTASWRASASSAVRGVSSGPVAWS